MEEVAGHVMKQFIEFLKKEDGPTAVEYAVMLALIIVVCLTAITNIGTRANTTLSSAPAAMAAVARSIILPHMVRVMG